MLKLHSSTILPAAAGVVAGAYAGTKAEQMYPDGKLPLAGAAAAVVLGASMARRGRGGLVAKAAGPALVAAGASYLSARYWKPLPLPGLHKPESPMLPAAPVARPAHPGHAGKRR